MATAAVEHKWEITNKIERTNNEKKTIVIEYFMQGKHLQSEGWKNPPEFDRYNYIPDSQIHNFPTCRFHIESLIHATTPKAAADIGKERGLRSTLKRLKGYKGLKGDKGLNLIWWGITLIKKDIDEYTEACKTFLRNDLKMGYSDMIKHMTSFCSSAPFDRTSRYGNIVFKYTFEDLLEEYSTQFCEGKDPEFRVLGTFAYKKEVMHVILVCPGDRSEFPRMDETDKTVIRKEGNDWIWKPEATGGTMIGDQFRRWEHATVAFDVPEGRVFKLENLDMHVSYSASADEKVFRTHTDTTNDRKRFSVDEVLRFFYKEIYYTADSTSEHNS